MKTFAKLLIVLLLAGTAAASWAAVSREQAATIAQRSAQGRVLAVERAETQGRPVWRVKLVTASGEVRVILVDAATGDTF